MYKGRWRYKNILLVLLLGLLLALLVKANTGDTYMFCAYHSPTSIFPGRITYGFLYFLRIIILSLMIGESLDYCKTVNKTALLITLTSYLFSLLEYKLVFGCESILIAIVFNMISVALLVFSVISCTIRRRLKSIWIFELILVSAIILYITVCLITVIV